MYIHIPSYFFVSSPPLSFCIACTDYAASQHFSHFCELYCIFILPFFDIFYFRLSDLSLKIINRVK